MVMLVSGDAAPEGMILYRDIVVAAILPNAVRTGAASGNPLHEDAMKLLHRYILAEVFGPFVLGLMTFTLVVLLHRFSRLTDLIVAKGVPASLAGRLLLSFLPVFLEITLPAALLLAVLLALGRLGSDSETTAMFSSGMGMRSVAVPVFVISFGVFLLNLFIGWQGVAWGNRQMKTTVARILSLRAGAGASEHVFQEITPDVLLFPDRISPDGRRMDGILVARRMERRDPVLVFARQGEFAQGSGEQAVGLTLSDGEIHSGDPVDNVYRVASFRGLEFRLPMAVPDTVNPGDPKNLTIPQLLAKAREGAGREEGNELTYHLHRRLSLAASCLAFGLLAVPLGLTQRARGKSPALAITVLLILFYYVFLAAAGALTSRFPAGTVALLWTPNVLVLLLAFLALRRSETGPLVLPSPLAALLSRR